MYVKAGGEIFEGEVETVKTIEDLKVARGKSSGLYGFKVLIGWKKSTQVLIINLCGFSGLQIPLPAVGELDGVLDGETPGVTGPNDDATVATGVINDVADALGLLDLDGVKAGGVGDLDAVKVGIRIFPVWVVRGVFVIVAWLVIEIVGVFEGTGVGVFEGDGGEHVSIVNLNVEKQRGPISLFTTINDHKPIGFIDWKLFNKESTGWKVPVDQVEGNAFGELSSNVIV